MMGGLTSSGAASALNASLKYGQAIEAANLPPDARLRFLHRLRLFAESSNVTCSQKTKVSSGAADSGLIALEWKYP
jgi:hypothetical protein